MGVAKTNIRKEIKTMQIQKKVNFQTIEQSSIETKNQEKSESKNTRRDVFESKINVQKEASLLETAKNEADYYVANVEGGIQTKDVDQLADDQKQKYAEAKENFKDAIQMMQEYLERQKAVLSKIRS
jgi:hypothetical protein